MSQHILVVGPNGFLSTQVIHLLRQRENTTFLTLVSCRGVADNVTSFQTVERLRAAHPTIDTIYLLGSYVPYGAFDSPNESLVRSNIVLVADLSLAYPEARIVFSSSVSVYGKPAGLPIGIATAFRDPDLYGLSKLAGEAIVRNHKSFGIIRFSSLIGKGMKVTTMVPRMIAAAQTGTITVYGDGARRQNYLDVRDAAAMCIAIADAKHNMIVLGVGVQSYTNKAVAELVQSLTGATLAYTGTDTSPSFDYETEASFSGMGYRPVYSLERTLRDYLDI